jgi:hypothetical protein
LLEVQEGEELERFTLSALYDGLSKQILEN